LADDVGEMFYYGETLWHKTGKQLKQPTNAEEAISASGLDGYVKPVPTQKDEALRREIARRMAVVRDDLNSGDPKSVLGLVYPGFRPQSPFSTSAHRSPSTDRASTCIYPD
jgi:hypothetical protein